MTMRLRNILIAPALIAIVALTAACDQLSQGNRYEISKDQAGRTLRLDKRTGDIAVIDGDKIVLLRDAKEVAQQQASEDQALASAKSFPKITVKHMLLVANLRTSWQNEKIYYAVSLHPLSGPLEDEKADSRDSKAKDSASDVAKKENINERRSNLEQFKRHYGRHNFTLLLEDVPFELLRDNLRFAYLADDKGETTGYEAKGSVGMPKDVYKKIDSWNINWQQRLR